MLRNNFLHHETKLFTKLEALHETTNIVKHYHHRLRYHQTETSTQTSANLKEGNGSLYIHEQIKDKNYINY